MKGILFDLDGTLHDSERWAKLAYGQGIASVLQRPMTAEEQDDMIGKPITVFVPKWYPGREEAILAAVLDYYEAHLMHRVTHYDGVREMLDALRTLGIRMGVVSSKLKRFVEPELVSTGLRPYFDVVNAYEDCAEHKPHPLPLLQAAGQMGLEPWDCLYVGDQPTDIRAAHAAGMGSVATLWGEGEGARLSAEGPTYVLQSPAEMVRVAAQGRRKGHCHRA